MNGQIVFGGLLLAAGVVLLLLGVKTSSLTDGTVISQTEHIIFLCSGTICCALGMAAIINACRLFIHKRRKLNNQLLSKTPLSTESTNKQSDEDGRNNFGGIFPC